jgi:spore coat polysaccharide biosynthesis protein SpsF
MKVAGVLQVRAGSTRLPGKALRPLAGAPMLERQLERVRRARRLDALTVATSAQADDDAIEALCGRLGVACYRGSLEDVLDRFYRAARAAAPSHVVRLTGDCPLADPALIDEVVRYCVQGGYDYASNALEPTFPDGLDVEAMRLESLASAWREAKLPSEREHVTPFLYKHPERFRVGSFRGAPDLSALRWTVDEPEDFALVERIYGELYAANPAFSTADVLALLERKPELRTLNTTHRRNEGYEKSLAGDPR